MTETKLTPKPLETTQKALLPLPNMPLWRNEALHRLHDHSSSDFVMMWILAKQADCPDGKLYLSQLSQELNIPIPKLSKIARSLQSQGLVEWRHDGSGEEGTYLLLSDTGLETTQRQQNKLRTLYANVLEAYGEEKFVALWKELTVLEDLTLQEIQKMDQKEADCHA